MKKVDLKKRKEKFKKQREKRGWDDSETWCLTNSFFEWAIPRLKRFKELIICYPCSLTMDKWKDIIQKMIDGFELGLKVDGAYYTLGDKEYKKMTEALDLWHKWFFDLWW